MTDDWAVSHAALVALARGLAPAGSLMMLAGCATPALTGGACVRWGISLEPRIQLSVDPAGEAKPVAQLGARPVCTKRRPSDER